MATFDPDKTAEHTVWNGQESPPFRAAGRSWWEYRKPIDNDRRMYTLLRAGGERSIYMVTLPYG
jgi:hypothetical protein